MVKKKKEKLLLTADEYDEFVKAMIEQGMVFQPFEKKDGMAKDDFSVVKPFIKRLQDKGLKVESAKKGDGEPLVYANEKQICHIGIREGCLMSLGMVQKDGKFRYWRITNHDELNEAFNHILWLAEEEPLPVENNNTKSLDDLKERIKNSSAKSIHVKHLTKEMKDYLTTEKMEFFRDDNGYTVRVKT